MQVIKNGRFVFNPLSEPIFTKKAYTFQYLSYRPLKRLELGLFQAVMWSAQQTGNANFDFNIINPLIFSHLAQYNLNESNNVMLGANINVKITSSINLYGQLMADDIKNKQTGFQGGVKYFDVAKINNLYMQVEYNRVGAYSYAFNDAFQSFSHYNQPIAHPLGANFNELVGIANYRWKDIFITGKINLISYGQDVKDFYAGNTVITDYLPSDVQQNTMQYKANTSIIDAKLGYVINRASNLNVSVGAMLRNNQTSTGSLQTNYVYLSVGTSVINKYYDF
jgi:hypothetical protein